MLLAKAIDAQLHRLKNKIQTHSTITSLMPRFYCARPLDIGTTIDLPEDIAHHVFVLRLQVGDKIELFNGEGGAYIAIVTEIGKKRAMADVKLHLNEERELAFGLNLAQALPEGSKMDWIIEKAIELGVNSIQPLAEQRSVVKLNATWPI